MTFYQAHHDQISPLLDFFVKGDVLIDRVDTKEQVRYIFTNPLDTELSGYLHYNINGC